LIAQCVEILNIPIRRAPVVFDRTGTLTLGVMTVAEIGISPECELTEAELLGLAAAAELASAHPFGKAIVAAAS
jgi:cation transport ATPase